MEKDIVFKTINRLLARVNRPLLERHPALWVQGYPWILFMLLPISLLILLLLQTDTEQPGTTGFTMQILLPFSPLVFLWMGLGPGNTIISPSDYYSNNGLFLIPEEKKILWINLAIVLIPFLICMNSIYNRFDEEGFTTSETYNRALISDYVKGEYYYLKKEDVSAQKSISILQDSVYPFLKADRFPLLSQAVLEIWIGAVSKTDSVLLLENYSNALRDPMESNDSRIRINRMPYFMAVERLNEKSAATLPPFLSSLLFFCAILIAYYCLANLYFKGILDLYKKHPFHQNIQLIPGAIIGIFIFLVAVKVMEKDALKNYLDITDKVTLYVREAAVIFIKIFNVVSIPLFLYYYFEKFISLKLELLGQFSSPRDPEIIKK
jgi:hypothetical protein